MPQYAYEVYTKENGVLVPLTVLEPPYTTDPGAEEPTPYIPPGKVTGLTVTEVV